MSSDFFDLVLAKEIDIAKLMKGIPYAEEQTAEAARDQASLFLQAANFRVQKFRRRHTVEAQLKLVRSRYAKRYRTELQELGQRVTDKEIEEKLLRNKFVIRLTRRLNSVEEQEEYSKLLLESLRMRKDSLKIVAELVGAEVYVSRRMEGSDTELKAIRQRLAEKYPGKTRKEKRREKDYGK